MKDEYIVIGAYPRKERFADFHGGGQLTARVLLEILNYGLLIISTEVGGISNSIIHEHNGLISALKDKETLYYYIVTLGLSPKKRENFSKNGKKILNKGHEFNQNYQLLFDVFGDKS